ncbi:hypothetical protein [Proteus mirabilis]|uniref:hypothetical protein n=1 Tax=Proteus mirabilis TaxID=584 RepID=UPI00117A7632|nr:hypothetical protein [Proteus mirabilis]
MSIESLDVNLSNAEQCLSIVDENTFLKYVNNKLKDVDEENVKLLYYDIKKVIEYIISNKNKLTELCMESCKVDYISFNNETDKAFFLISSYAYFIRFIIEYNYLKSDSYLIEILIFPIYRFESYSYIYRNIRGEGNSVFLNYLYSKDHFLEQVIKNSVNNVSNQLLRIDDIESKLKLILDENNKLKEKVEKFGIAGSTFESEFKENLGKLKDKLEKEIFAKVDVIENLDKKVNEINDNLTFIGLEHAYKTFGEQKSKEKKHARTILKSSVCFLFLPIILKMILSLWGFKYNIYGYMFTATVMLIFLYLFKISLSNYQSIKAELTQINLRRSLCKFIQGYTEFAERNKEHNSLSKFESLMFSNVIPDNKKIPSTLDGVEQLAKLFESIKSK